jgi:hypothetical protein
VAALALVAGERQYHMLLPKGYTDMWHALGEVRCFSAATMCTTFTTSRRLCSLPGPCQASCHGTQMVIQCLVLALGTLGNSGR